MRRISAKHVSDRLPALLQGGVENQRLFREEELRAHEHYGQTSQAFAVPRLIDAIEVSDIVIMPTVLLSPA